MMFLVMNGRVRSERKHYISAGIQTEWGLYMIKLGEICFSSGNVRKLADFYKRVLMIDNGSDDNSLQVLEVAGVRISIFDDGTTKPNNNQNITLIFDVDDVDGEYERLRGIEGFKLHFIRKPYDGSDGHRFMSFYDLDGNRVNFRNIGEKS